MIEVICGLAFYLVGRCYREQRILLAACEQRERNEHTELQEKIPAHHRPAHAGFFLSL